MPSKLRVEAAGPLMPVSLGFIGIDFVIDYDLEVGASLEPFGELSLPLKQSRYP